MDTLKNIGVLIKGIVVLLIIIGFLIITVRSCVGSLGESEDKEEDQASSYSTEEPDLNISNTSFTIYRVEVGGFEYIDETLNDVGLADSYVVFREDDALVKLDEDEEVYLYSTTFSVNHENAVAVNFVEFNEDYIDVYPEAMTIAFPNGDKYHYLKD